MAKLIPTGAVIEKRFWHLDHGGGEEGDEFLGDDPPQDDPDYDSEMELRAGHADQINRLMRAAAAHRGCCGILPGGVACLQDALEVGLGGRKCTKSHVERRSPREPHPGSAQIGPGSATTRQLGSRREEELFLGRTSYFCA